ncbi:hypothetical protein GCM10010383_22650 [Streptomyces lomondensis]|uniref:Uncharacterized protein n=1 Tax=Streptomyces lomondensis TaxID=68229 RepID=A0ABQ2X1N0_9ACTN|nr:hypothetical protein GCM10010383_22650 [Streptomyces lomondensis]
MDSTVRSDSTTFSLRFNAAGRLRALLQRYSKSGDKVPETSPVQALRRLQVHGPDHPRLGQPCCERYTQNLPLPLALEDQDAPAFHGTLLHGLPEIARRVEDRTANTIGTDLIPALPEPSVANHQGVPFGVEPGPPHGVGIVGQCTRGARDRLGRLP